MSAKRPLVFIIAGEQSGDLLGSGLMAALREKTQDRIDFAGVGGAGMTGQGLRSLFPIAELSIMGIAEIIPKIPKILWRLNQTVAEIKRLRPDVLVTIDAPDFSFRVAKRAKMLGVPRIHYVAPSVWAWRPGRARKIARFLDHLLALFPFEPPYFEIVGLACTFVGHPAIEGGAGRGDGASFRARHRIPPDRKILIMLPGSRRGEIDRLLPIFIDAIQLLLTDRDNITIVVPVVANIAGVVRDRLAASQLEAIIVEGEAEKFDAFAAADLALAKSGTVTLELALAGVPSVIAYRINPVSHVIASRIATGHFAGLPNVILNRRLMPELLQDDCRPDRLAAELAALLEDAEVRRKQIEGAAEIKASLSIQGKSPSAAAADIVLQVISEKGGRPLTPP